MRLRKSLTRYSVGVIGILTIILLIVQSVTPVSAAESKDKVAPNRTNACVGNYYSEAIDDLYRLKGSETQLQADLDRAKEQVELGCFTDEDIQLFEEQKQRYIDHPLLKTGEVSGGTDLKIAFTAARDEFIAISYKNSFKSPLRILSAVDEELPLQVSGTRYLFHSPQGGKYVLSAQSSTAVSDRDKVGKYKIILSERPNEYTENGHLTESHHDRSYLLQAREGEQVTVVMRSDDMDSLLRVYNGSKWLTNDDERPGEPNARVSFIAPQTGLYEVQAASYLPEESGDYFLKINFQG